MRKLISLIVAVLAAIIAIPLLGGAAIFGGVSTTCVPATTAPSTSASVLPGPIASGGPVPALDGWDGEQLAHVATILAVGNTKAVPPWGWVVATATAMQESGLRNLAGGADDSIGLFQQRPSQGWGTPEQLMSPAYQAGKFFDKLLTVEGWQQMPLTEAAQKVQRSAYPDAYAKHTAEAIRLVSQQHAAASGGVELGCSTMTLGTAKPAPRNSDGSWPEEGCTIRPDPTTGGGCVTPRLLHLVQQATAAGFPKPGCYRVDDHGEHPKGRACDWMMTSGGEASGAQKARGDAMAAWAVANADDLGIAYVIWFRMIWTHAEGWHAYNNPWGGNNPSGWHTNHIHISVE